MRKFIIKTTIFLIPFIVIMNIPKCTNYIFKTELKAKINTLVDDNSKQMIIVCGDSRAERHIIPSIIEDRLGIKTVNIAINLGDLDMYYYALKEYDLVHPKNVLVISTSSWQTNDNIINEWIISHANVTHISFIDKIKLFKKDYINMLHERLRRILKELFRIDSKKVLSPNDIRIKTKGFYGVEGFVNREELLARDLYKDGPRMDWYLGGEHDGIRKKVFKEVVGLIAGLNMKTIIIQPPVSPTWREKTKNTYIDSIETNHSNLLLQIANQYSNVACIDFYQGNHKTDHDSMFYNSLHLNYKGAEIFTNTLVDSLILRNLLK